MTIKKDRSLRHQSSVWPQPKILGRGGDYVTTWRVQSIYAGVQSVCLHFRNI